MTSPSQGGVDEDTQAAIDHHASRMRHALTVLRPAFQEAATVLRDGVESCPACGADHEPGSAQKCLPCHKAWTQAAEWEALLEPESPDDDSGARLPGAWVARHRLAHLLDVEHETLLGGDASPGEVLTGLRREADAAQKHHANEAHAEAATALSRIVALAWHAHATAGNVDPAVWLVKTIETGAVPLDPRRVDQPADRNR